MSGENYEEPYDPLSKFIWLLVICIILGTIRFFMPTHGLSAGGSYQAIAHVWVGGLFGAWLVTREKTYGVLAWGLLILEVVAFTMSRMP